VKAGDALFAAVVGVGAALGPVIAVGITAATMTVLSSSPAEAYCKPHGDVAIAKIQQPKKTASARRAVVESNAGGVDGC